MPTNLYTRWDLDSETSRFTPRQNKTRSFGNMVMSYFQRTRPECEIESFITAVSRKKIDCFSVDGFCSHCTAVFEAMGCFYQFCPCQELRPSLNEEDIQRGSKKRELDALRRQYIQKKGYNVIRIRECEWWRLYKITNNVKQYIREDILCRRSLAAEQVLEEIKEGKLIEYVQCDIEVPEILRTNSANFPPVFKNTLVSKSQIGDLMQNYAEEERLWSQPQKMLISTSHYKLEHLLLLYSFSVSNWVLFERIALFCWVHSEKKLQQLCAVSSGRMKAKWRKSKHKCRRRNNEASS